jgi:anti-anti-sigma factor
MATQPLTPPGLTLQLEEKPNETVVHCTGRINAENSEVFQRKIRNLIPEPSSQSTTITHRIVLDVNNVTHVDCSGLGALLGA